MNVAIITAAGAESREALWAEHRKARLMVWAASAAPVFIAVNGAGIDHPDPMPHWASIHIDDLYRPNYRWAEKREANGLGSDYTRWSPSKGGNVDRVLKTYRGGSSGLFALGVALHGLHCDAAILVGMPMDGRPNPYNYRSKKGWANHKDFRPSWEKPKTLKEIAPVTRSMSGWTRELLGAPSADWLRTLREREAA